MPVSPKAQAAIRVPEDLLPNLRFAWPGGTDPSGFLGIGGITSLGAPLQYAFTGSNVPFGTEPMAVAVTMTPSSTPSTTAFPAVIAAGSRSPVNPGFHVDLRSGQVVAFDISSNAVTVTLAVSRSTGVGDVHRVIYQRNPLGARFASLSINGTLQSSTADCASWTGQYSVFIGGFGASNVYSHGVRDVYVFNKTLTTAEVSRLDQFLATGVL